MVTTAAWNKCPEYNSMYEYEYRNLLALLKSTATLENPISINRTCNIVQVTSKWFPPWCL